MPDRQPPHWGHEPEDGRDLDGLLSVEEILTDEALLAGQLAGISDSQRPVAGAMSALRTAPAASELAGEAAARAAFRALLEPAAAEPHHTLVLPVPAQGRGPRPAARHRRRRRAGADRRGWRVVALVGSAAAVVAVGVAALSGTFGFTGHRGQSANPSASQSSTQPGASPVRTGQAVLGTATKDSTPSATPKASATPGAIPSNGASQTPGDLCSQYFGSFSHRSRGDRTKDKELFEKLSQLAGSDSPGKVLRYCAEQLDGLLTAATPQPTSGETWRFSGAGNGDGKGGPDSGVRTDRAGSGQATSGPAGGDSGHGGSQ